MMKNGGTKAPKLQLIIWLLCVTAICEIYFVIYYFSWLCMHSLGLDNKINVQTRVHKWLILQRIARLLLLELKQYMKILKIIIPDAYRLLHERFFMRFLIFVPRNAILNSMDQFTNSKPRALINAYYIEKLLKMMTKLILITQVGV
jgi:hypothetical protein